MGGGGGGGLDLPLHYTIRVSFRKLHMRGNFNIKGGSVLM